MTYVNHALVNETCPVCSQGRVFVAEAQKNGALFLMCEDCESEWGEPNESRDAVLATRYRHPFSRYLEPNDLINHPWYASILNK
jgi:hypothetical protein